MRISLIGATERLEEHQAAWRGLASVVDPAAGAHAVSLCCDPREQSRRAVQLLRRGVPVLASLPLGRTVDELETVLDAAARTRALFQPAVWLRLAPQVQCARDAMFRGSVGRVRSVEITLPGDQTFFGAGLHAVDLAQYLLHSFDRVSVESGSAVRELSLTSWQSVPCTIRLGEWRPAFCIINGSGGSIELGWRESLVRRHGKPAVCIGEKLSERDGLRLAAAEFADALRTGGNGWTSLEDLSKTTEALRAAAASIARGEEFEVAQPLAA